MADIVPGYGPRNAKIIVVGEAPAKNEVREGRPFMGRGGDVLNTILRSANIPRESVYITNASLEPVSTVVKDLHFFQWKTKNNFGPPTQAYLDGIAQLVRDINEIRPNVVIALGNYALWALMQHQGIMNWRGSILWSRLANVKVVPTIHPAALLRGRDDDGRTTTKEGGTGGMWKMLSAVVHDVQKAKVQSKFPEYKLRPRNILFNPVGAEAEAAVDRLLRGKVMHFDVETHGGTNLSMAGFSDGDPEWAVVWLAKNYGFHTLEEGTITYPGQLGIIKGLLESDIPKAGQNIHNYDVPMLDSIGIHVRNIWWDTLVAQHVLVPDLPKKLAFQTSIYTDIPFYKPEGKILGKIKSPSDLRQAVNYCGKDVCSTSEIQPQQEEILKERHILDYFEHRMRMVEPLREAMRDGFKANLHLLWRLAKETDEKLQKATKDLNALAGYEVNANSHVQVKKLLYEDRKIPERRHKGKLTSDAHVLADITARSGDPAPALITSVRGNQKLLSNYYNAKILSPDGRIRTTFNLAGIKHSGRVSSSDPLWGPGIPIQTIPNKSRRLFVADDGREILEVDGAQAEAVITAFLANDPIHMDCFRNGKDVHRVTAALLNGMDPALWATIPKNAEIRDIAKTCNHELNYGAGWFMFMLTVNEEYDPEVPGSLKLSRDLAQILWHKYHEIRPALAGYWETIRRELRSNGMRLDTPLGWHRYFLDQWSDSMLNEAYSFKPQNTVGESTCIGILQVKGILPPPFENEEMRRMQAEVKKAGVKLMAHVHDSATWNVPKGEDDLCRGIMSLMEVPLYINGYHVVVPMEGKVGPNWFKGDKEDKGEMRDLGVTRKTVELPSEVLHLTQPMPMFGKR